MMNTLFSVAIGGAIGACLRYGVGLAVAFPFGTLSVNMIGSFAIGVVWMTIHAILLILVAKLIKAPYFFLAVGSQANVGGAASAPIVASAFHPSLATVGVLLAVFGYAVGTIAAIGCTILMELAAVS